MGMPATRKPAQVNVKARVIAYIKAHPLNHRWHAPNPRVLLGKYMAQADPASRGKDRSWPAQVDWVWTHL